MPASLPERSPRSPRLDSLIGRLTDPAAAGHPDRPAITISYAQSLDGSIAALPGDCPAP